MTVVKMPHGQHNPNEAQEWCVETLGPRTPNSQPPESGIWRRYLSLRGTVWVYSFVNPDHAVLFILRWGT